MSKLLTATNTAPDQQQRDAALDIGQSCIVEAPAGSGKTGLLVQRFLKLLAYAELDQPEQVLAITFARDATAEIRNRISIALERAAHALPLERLDDPHERLTRQLANAVLARSRERQWKLLEQPQRLNVRSIDSVCADIVNHLPILSLAGARLEPVDNAAPLYQEAARRTLLSLDGSAAQTIQAALTTLLLHRDGNLADCERLLAEMLQWRDQWGRLVPLGEELNENQLDNEVKPKLERALQHAICDTLAEAQRLFPADDLHELAKLTGGAARVLDEEQRASKIDVWLGRKHAPGCAHDELEAWRALAHQLLTKGEWRKAAGINVTLGYRRQTEEAAAKKDLLARLAGNDALRDVLAKLLCLPDAEYPPEQWQVAKALFHLLNASLVELKLLFAETGQCDFAELSLAAQHALDQPAGLDDLESSMGTRLQHLLVDEMQDTSVSQYGLLKGLTASWDGHSQTVFLVGDPKQSIYLFRQARVELFEQTARNGLGGISLQRLRLTANFRSQGRLVQQFNDDFARIFPDASESCDPGASKPHGQVAYTPAAPVRPASAAGIVWYPQIHTGERNAPETKERRQQLMQEEADKIVGILRRHHELAKDQNLPAPRIAVLVRARSHLRLIASRLREDGSVPFRAVEIEALNEQQEVIDALSLTRALLHPADRVAWLALLRAPWCGITLADLQLLTGSDNYTDRQKTAEDLMEANLDKLNQDSRLRVERLRHTMQAAQALRDCLPLAQWVERTWHALGGMACADAQGRANVDAYFRLLNQCAEEGASVDATSLTQRMEKLYATPLTTDRHAVELMTIHGAKGLEWDVVIVPGLERPPANNQASMLAWLELPQPIHARNEMGANDTARDGDTMDGNTPDERIFIDATFAVLAPIQAKGEKNARLNSWVRALKHEREAAEYKRLYYVACTRAREELHLFATARTTDAGYEKHASSLLSTAWAVAQQHFERRAAAALEAAANAPAELQDSVHERGRLLVMPSLAESVGVSEVGVIGSIAATEGNPPDAERPASLLRRIPLSFDPLQQQVALRSSDAILHSASTSAEHSVPEFDSRSMRPQGSLAARALGNAAHAFLDKLAAHFAEGGTLEDAARLPSLWKPRIAAFLRSQGLSPQDVEHAKATTVRALAQTLEDPQGQWILASHKNAQSEAALQGWNSLADERSPEKANTALEPGSTGVQMTGVQMMSVRMDRVFAAGAAPLALPAAASTHIWIIDYKTAEHTGAGLEEFLRQEKETYRLKLESYAHIVRLQRGELRRGDLQRGELQDGEAAKVNLALYYPLMKKLVWWPHSLPAAHP